MNNVMSATVNQDTSSSMVAKKRTRRVVGIAVTVSLIGGSIFGIARARQGTPTGPCPALVFAAPTPEHSASIRLNVSPIGEPAPKWGRIEIEHIFLAHPAPFGSPAQSTRLPRPVFDRWLKSSNLSKSGRETLLNEVSATSLESCVAIPAGLPSKMPRARDRTIINSLLTCQIAVNGRLEVPLVGELDELVNYWSRGQDASQIREFLEARRGQSIDIASLLPETPRRLLNTFPSHDSAGNCAWTSLHFSTPNAEPDYVGLDDSLLRLYSSYREINAEPEFGDLLLISNSEGPVHVVVHVAGDIVFSKPSVSALTPWRLAPLTVELAPFRLQGEAAPSVRIFRKKPPVLPAT